MFSSAPEASRATGSSRGCLDLAFAARAGRTVLDRRVFTYPFTVTRAYYRDTAPAGMASVVLQSVSGSLNPGDCLHQRLVARPQAAAYVTAQGATTVVGDPEAPKECREALEIVAEAGSVLEYMADLRILFPGAMLSQSASVRLAPDATVVICDGFVAHDHTGLSRPFGAFRTETRIEDEAGRLLAMDCGRLSGMSPLFAAGSRFKAYGTLVVALRRPEAETARLVSAISAAIAGTEVYGAASALPNGCGVSARLAAADGGALRRGIAAGWRAARMQLFGTVPGLLGQAAWQPMAG
jgi:urease accessory protein